MSKIPEEPCENCGEFAKVTDLLHREDGSMIHHDCADSPAPEKASKNIETLKPERS